MNRLRDIETKRQIHLPKIYKSFYKLCASSVPANLVGTDLFNHYAELNEWAVELLKDDGAEQFLNDDDFVFMMHQGYIFWYFKADGTPDPIVYGYYQGKLKPDNLGTLSNFINEYTH